MEKITQMKKIEIYTFLLFLQIQRHRKLQPPNHSFHHPQHNTQNPCKRTLRDHDGFKKTRNLQKCELSHMSWLTPTDFFKKHQGLGKYSQLSGSDWVSLPPSDPTISQNFKISDPLTQSRTPKFYNCL